MRVAASSLWVLVCVRAGTLLCVAAVCAVCCVAVFVECAATDWGGDTVLLVTVSASCPLTGLLWERRCLVSAAPVRAPCVRYLSYYYYCLKEGTNPPPPTNHFASLGGV